MRIFIAQRHEDIMEQAKASAIRYEKGKSKDTKNKGEKVENIGVFMVPTGLGA